MKQSRTLGPISANFINELYKAEKTLFTLSDAVVFYGHSNRETSKFLSALVRRGVLARIKSGTYLILQMGQENNQLSNWPLIADALAGGNNYFISHYSAMRLHGMTTHPLIDVYLTLPKRMKSKKIHNTTYHFIYSRPNHFWGGTAHWASKQEKVKVSDIERTILDGLNRPDLCGGITEVIRGVWGKQKEIDWEKLTKYAKNFQTKAAIKRLGFILQILNLGESCIPELKKNIISAKDYVLLDPNGPVEGKYGAEWRIRINASIEELKASIWG